jgi:uncharacterized membrane protein
MNTTLAADENRSRSEVQFVEVPLSAPIRWLGYGWLDMRRNWVASLAYGALIVALGWTLLVFCGTHPYFIAAAITGFLLVGPLVSAGLCEMSRRYSTGERASFDDSLEGFARNLRPLSEFGLILAICGAGWFLISALLLGGVFHIGAPNVAETMYRGFLDSTNRPQILAYVAVGGVLAVAVFTVSVVAIPLIIDRKTSASEAMRQSVRATLRNAPAMILWSALILLLTIVGYAPLLFGMLLIAPLLGHATWHAYLGMTGRPHSAPLADEDAREGVTAQVSTANREDFLNPNDAREVFIRKIRNLMVPRR